MNPHLHFTPRPFAARVAELGFTARLPADWISHALPDEPVDLDDPSQFLPLAVLTAPHAAIVLAVAARPAHDDGTLHDWAWYHLNQQGLQPRTVGRAAVAGVAAVAGEALQPSDLGPMLVRFAFLEDGGRLLNLTLTAPELLADAVRDAWFELLRSFTLETPRGSRFALEGHADEQAAEPLPEPGLASRPTAAPDLAAVRDSETGEPLLQPPLQLPLPGPSAAPRTAMFDYALSDDSASLDEDHPINARLRDRGIGLVPNIAGLSDAARCATLAAGAVMAQFDVPYGWHVIDDGRRTLVFEPGGQVQINLDLLPRQGRDDSAVLGDIATELRSSYAGPALRRVPPPMGLGLHATDIADGDQPLEQWHLLRPYRDDAMVLRARVTATPGQSGNAVELAGLILSSLTFAPEPDDEGADAAADEADEPAPADGLPAWWHHALALESRGEVDAAEQHIREQCPSLGYAHATADLHRLRMLRLKAAGDEDGARRAFLRASDFIWRYASMATSGGEGAALSLQRDEFRARLVAEYGSDPEARA